MTHRDYVKNNGAITPDQDVQLLYWFENLEVMRNSVRLSKITFDAPNLPPQR
jgi:hypothetical protein